MENVATNVGRYQQHSVAYTTGVQLLKKIKTNASDGQLRTMWNDVMQSNTDSRLNGNDVSLLGCSLLVRCA